MRPPPSFAVVAFFVARKQWQFILAGFAASAMTAQLIDFRAEGFYVLKASVNGSESHIAHLVQLPQLLHDHLAHAARSDFPLAQTAQLVADSGHGGLDGVPADRALFERFLHAVQQLLLVERLTAAIALDARGQQQLRRLEGSEALRAAQAFAPPADLPPFARDARVDDLSLRVTAKRTMHGQCLSGVRRRG